jgi:DNA-binding MarR family transcriptional regulator
MLIRPSSYRRFLARRCEPVSVGDLARYLLIRHHTAVELVDRMAKLKIISRSVDADGRRVLVQLTREGERRLQRLSKIHLGELPAIGPTLTKMLKLFRQPRDTARAARF